jgi:hypothetical protein
VRHWVDRGDVKVSFHDKVQIRPIPAVGRMRSCKAKGASERRGRWSSPRGSSSGVISQEEDSVKIHKKQIDNIDEGKVVEIEEVKVNNVEKGVLAGIDERVIPEVDEGQTHTCGIGNRMSWADTMEGNVDDDVEWDVDVNCPACRRVCEEMRSQEEIEDDPDSKAIDSLEFTSSSEYDELELRESDWVSADCDRANVVDESVDRCTDPDKGRVSDAGGAHGVEGPLEVAGIRLVIAPALFGGGCIPTDICAPVLGASSCWVRVKGIDSMTESRSRRGSTGLHPLPKPTCTHVYNSASVYSVARAMHSRTCAHAHLRKHARASHNFPLCVGSSALTHQSKSVPLSLPFTPTLPAW